MVHHMRKAISTRNGCRPHDPAREEVRAAIKSHSWTVSEPTTWDWGTVHDCDGFLIRAANVSQKIRVGHASSPHARELLLSEC